MYVNLAAHGFAKKGEVIASSLQDDEPLSRIADLETLVSHRCTSIKLLSHPSESNSRFSSHLTFR